MTKHPDFQGAIHQETWHIGDHRECEACKKTRSKKHIASSMLSSLTRGFHHCRACGHGFCDQCIRSLPLSATCERCMPTLSVGNSQLRNRSRFRPTDQIYICNICFNTMQHRDQSSTSSSLSSLAMGSEGCPRTISNDLLATYILGDFANAVYHAIGRKKSSDTSTKNYITNNLSTLAQQQAIINEVVDLTAPFYHLPSQSLHQLKRNLNISQIAVIMNAVEDNIVPNPEKQRTGLLAGTFHDVDQAAIGGGYQNAIEQYRNSTKYQGIDWHAFFAS